MDDGLRIQRVAVSVDEARSSVARLVSGLDCDMANKEVCSEHPSLIRLRLHLRRRVRNDARTYFLKKHLQWLLKLHVAEICLMLRTLDACSPM